LRLIAGFGLTMTNPDMNKAKKAKIISDPGILGGTPVFEGTRIPAGNIVAEVKAGTSRFDIFRHYPNLPLDGVEAAIEWDRAGRPL
jgi:uncharacterized protein (DUF433 family)